MKKITSATTISGTTLRSWLRDIARKRKMRTVTADDAHKFFDRIGIDENSVDVRLSYINSVLREPDFTPIGSVPSKRPRARGRHITQWAT
jgi:hypothetical protein